MNKLIFATNNPNKVSEIKYLLDNLFEIHCLKDAGIDIDIPEPHDTLEENATEKSTTIFKLTNLNCFSEDTGLEVEILNGRPGVKSARYAGDECDNLKNINKLLNELADSANRQAQFKTVISLIMDGIEYRFTGICKGQITKEMKGSYGFGYDSIFIPEGADKTFAEMTMEEKNTFSHRKKATHLLIDFLNKLNVKN